MTIEKEVLLLSKAQADKLQELVPNANPRQVSDDRYITGIEALDGPTTDEVMHLMSALPRCLVRIHDPVTEFGSSEIEIVESSITVEERKPRVYQPTGQPHERPPFPEKGDWSERALYESVGRALSAWESLETAYALLFGAFLSPSWYFMPPMRAYGSVTGFRARAGMVKAAADAFFLESEPTADTPRQREEFRRLNDLVAKYSERRNDIAHAIVGPYSSPLGYLRGLALLPPTHATKKQKFREDLPAHAAPHLRPAYAYTSAEITFFANEFLALCKPVSSLALDITTVLARDGEHWLDGPPPAEIEAQTKDENLTESH
ncbi:hypothetical protein EI171_11545 [Bradyrhizobium sp. LCT2]|uniref:hypothetical protein n=1 Tax=Bradyrhizobium sp. LCT2 TaxID=2493093 RepID=UPI0013738D50|nr:hypothetical protein [Bradyrhizobium sp. LCT2]QHP67937.1 hypothetical protein EI171_11545 [Bradyrhizobium sp. LCT2]